MNVLLYAHRSDLPQHPAVRPWFEAEVAGPRWTQRASGLRWLVLAIAAALAGCGEHSDGEVIAPPTGMRIVSLTPAVSQMLVDLGLDEAIVAVSENDDAAPAGLPVVGTFLDVDAERLVGLRPTHVVMMHGKEGPPTSLVQLADAVDVQLAAYRYPETIDAVLATLAGPLDGATPVGAFVAHGAEADRLAATVRRQLDAIAAAVPPDDADRPRVLMVFGTSPVMASGSGTVLDEMLRIAGGRNAAAGNGLTAPVYDREALVTLAPDVILLLMPGAPPLTDGDARLAELRGLPIPAVEDDRVVLLNDPLVLLPSTQIPRVAAAMAKATHPDRADAIDAALATPAPEEAAR